MTQKSKKMDSCSPDAAFQAVLEGLVRVPKKELEQAEREYKAARKKAKAGLTNRKTKG